jgi:hypothetical protein
MVRQNMAIKFLPRREDVEAPITMLRQKRSRMVRPKVFLHAWPELPGLVSLVQNVFLEVIVAPEWLSTEPLQKGMAQYSWAPSLDQLFWHCKHFLLFYKTSHLNVEV